MRPPKLLNGGWSRSSPRSLLNAVIAFAVAAATFAAAYSGGSYELETRSVVAIAAWWAVLFGVALGVWPLERVPRAALVTGALMAAFAGWTLLSAAWADSPERSVTEFNRVTMYLGIFALTVVASSRATIRAWTAGVAVALVAVACLSLATRLFGIYEDHAAKEFLPSTVTRLSFPVGYWNGLGILVALAVPLLLGAASAARRSIVRGLAVAPIPIIVAVIYLASSRGAAATALVGAAVFVVVSPRRAAALGAALTAIAGAAAAVAILVPRSELVNGPLDSSAATTQGVSAAALLAAACVGCGVIYALLSPVVERARLPATATRIVTASTIAVVVIGVVAADPIQLFDDFRQPPSAFAAPRDDFVRSHLLSGNGSGRWQFWESALAQFKTAPVYGQGAGSYEAWWTEHGTLAMFIRDAHSLYLETLGELGLVGLGLLAGVGVAAAAAGWSRIRAGDDIAPPLLALLAAFAVAAAVDWIWELTIVTAVAVVAAGLLTGIATQTQPTRPADEPATPRLGLGVAVVAVAWFFALAHAAPLLAELRLNASRDASARAQVASAVSDAEAARAIQPWSAAPHLQLALVAEQAGDLRLARASIEAAIERDPRDWRLWLVDARLETESGRIEQARRSLARAEQLNPRSPLFAP